MMLKRVHLGVDGTTSAGWQRTKLLSATQRAYLDVNPVHSFCTGARLAPLIFGSVRHVFLRCKVCTFFLPVRSRGVRSAVSGVRSPAQKTASAKGPVSGALLAPLDTDLERAFPELVQTHGMRTIFA